MAGDCLLLDSGSDRNDFDETVRGCEVGWVPGVERYINRTRDRCDHHRELALLSPSGQEHRGGMDPPVRSGCLGIEWKWVECCFGSTAKRSCESVEHEYVSPISGLIGIRLNALFDEGGGFLFIGIAAPLMMLGALVNYLIHTDRFLRHQDDLSSTRPAAAAGYEALPGLLFGVGLAVMSVSFPDLPVPNGLKLFLVLCIVWTLGFACFLGVARYRKYKAAGGSSRVR